MSTTTEAKPEEPEPRLGLDHYIASFLESLRVAGYAGRTLTKKRSVSKAFVRWLQRKEIRLQQLDESHIAAFLSAPPRKHNARVRFERSVLRLFLQYLRHNAGVPGPPPHSPSAVEELVGRYVSYLRKDRGLAENSIHVYAPLVREFVNKLAPKTGRIPMKAFDAAAIRSFLLSQGDRSSECIRLLATALRSFFRFLFLCGDLPKDLSAAVPTVRKWGRPCVPSFLSPAEIERVIAAPSMPTVTDRRDRAILLLLARLGLRAGEIVTLEIDDIHWRSGEIVIRGKGCVWESLPLPADVGEALARYLQEDRSFCKGRRVFQRVYAPLVGLTGPAAIGHIVRRALARAGIQRSGRGAAHLLRHGLATHMIRRGATLAEISEVLRHRSLNTTAVYAQVSFEALRTVARPWPISGGGR
jgi:integrase/recombinase XerD